MKILDDKSILAKYEKSKVAKTISFLPEQISESWQDVIDIKLPKKYNKPANLMVCGMGGSNLATELVRSIYGREMKIPFVLVRNYNVPNFVSNKSLVIVSSYSGNTEEPINCLKSALGKKANIFVMAGGGKLISLAKKHKLPYYKINSSK